MCVRLVQKMATPDGRAKYRFVSDTKDRSGQELGAPPVWMRFVRGDRSEAHLHAPFLRTAAVMIRVEQKLDHSLRGNAPFPGRQSIIQAGGVAREVST